MSSPSSTSTAYAGTWDENLNCWIGDAAGVERSVAADRGEVCSAYAPHGGRFSMDLGVLKQAEARWFNPRTGEFGVAFPVSPAGWHEFQSPDNEDWAMMVR